MDLKMKISKTHQKILKGIITGTFWFGAIIDFLMVIAWFLYAFFDISIFLSTMGFPNPTPATTDILMFGFGLMVGYTVLLVWGALRPLKRIGILFNVGIFVILCDICLNLFILVPRVPEYTMTIFWRANWMRFITLGLMLFSWLEAKVIFPDEAGKLFVNHQRIISKEKREFKGRKFLHASYGVGIGMDGLVAILMLLYMYGIDLSLLGFPPVSSDTQIVLSLGCALMIGWTFLLGWGIHRSIERRGLLMITAVAVIVPFLLYDIGEVIRFGFYDQSVGQFIGYFVLRLVLIGIMLGGYHIAKFNKDLIQTSPEKSK